MSLILLNQQQAYGYIIFCINKVCFRMSNRRNNTVLPILTNSVGSQNINNSFINIPYGSTSHKSVKYNKPNKWILTQSHVDRHISPKRTKPPINIQINTVHNLNNRTTNSQHKNVFFTGINKAQGKQQADRQRHTHLQIQKSTRYIDILRSNKKKLFKIRMITDPNLSVHKDASPKTKQLYSYLERNFVNSKRHNINNTVIQRFKTQSPERIFGKIQEKSRKFLLQKMQKDYMNYNKIETYKKQSIKTLIQQQIERKKKEFKEDYSKRYSSPYFYFLSLTKEEKDNIMVKKGLKDLHSI